LSSFEFDTAFRTLEFSTPLTFCEIVTSTTPF